MAPWKAVLHAAGDLRVEEGVDVGEPGQGQVRVAVKRVGICGSDVHYWQHGKIGHFVLEAPMVIGHESSGVVEAIGSGVRHLQPGDRVAMEPGVPCHLCHECKTGEYNLCPDMRFFATPPIDGSLCSAVLHDADLCFKLPASVSLEEGAMCEPLAVGVYACDRAGVAAGDRVLVLGAGPIGLVCALVARAYGARQVLLTDVSEERLAFARSLGFEGMTVAKRSPEEAAATICKYTDGPVDVSIECCGFESATRTGLMATKSNGCLCLVGMNQQEMKLPMFELIARQVDVRGVFRYRNAYPTCIALLDSKLVDVMPLITNRYSIDQIMDGFETARSDPTAIKVMFQIE